MRPKISEEVPAEAWDLLSDIRQIVDALPPLIETPAYIVGVRVAPDIAISHFIPNCHVVARAIAAFFPLELHDGMVGILREGKPVYLQHSWLTLPNEPHVIIDVWPLGSVGGPTIHIQDYAYHFGPESSFLAFREEDFLSEVESVTAAVREVIESLWPNRLSTAA